MKISRLGLPTLCFAALLLGAEVPKAPEMPEKGPAPSASSASSAPSAPSVPSVRQQSWRSATRDYKWSFPKDHWSHPDFKTEWWYFTGHLQATDDSTKRYAYQFTVFRVGVSPEVPDIDSKWAARSVFMGHAAITDLQSGKHIYSEVLYRTAPFLARFYPMDDSLIASSRARPGTSGEWELRWNGSGFDFAMLDRQQGFALELSTTQSKPMVFQGPNGYSQKGRAANAASLYYSFTRMATSGTITVADTPIPVSGESWMDKEFGSNQLANDQVGWDWFGLRLDDGRDIMLYALRDRDGRVGFRQGTVVGVDGTSTYLSEDGWSAQATASWTSPTTAARYPLQWTLEIPEHQTTLVIVPLTQDQENVSARVPSLFYWEGAVEVRAIAGEPIGRGFVELTGYGNAARPAI